MQLILNEDQTLLASTAREFAASTTPLARVRKLRDSRDPLGFSEAVWASFVEMGWTAIPFSEADGGLGLGLSDAAVVAEALGRELCPEPFVETVVLAGRCLSRAGTAAQKQAHLGPLILGKSRAALAHTEPGARGQLPAIRTRAERAEGGFLLRGEKAPILGGAAAETLIVPARTSGSDGDEAGVTLFLVPAALPGVALEPLTRVDGRNAARARFEVLLPVEAVLGPVDGGLPVLEAAVDDATVVLAAEMLGGMTGAFEMTLRYLKEREQFGAKIGSFQALQHRAARLFIELELTRSAVMAAARAVDDGLPGARELASVAKARASDAYRLVAAEALQLHGGIGMTDEHDVGFHVKRAKAAELTFGDAAFHRARFARLRGF